MRAFIVAAVTLYVAVRDPAGDEALRQFKPQMCSATRPTEAVPPSENDAFRGSNGSWYTNADQTIWAGGMATHLLAGPEGNKVPWIRPKGSVLTIVGRRLDGESPPLRVSVPCCYGGTFQATGLFVPSEGCWEITARAGDRKLTFVTEVKAAPKPQE